MGLKRLHEFEDLCKIIGHDPLPFKKFISVRFRVLRACIGPILYNFPALVKYYETLKKPTERQKLLQKFFVERVHMAKIKLLFIHSATADMTEAIDFFEQRKVNVHNAAEKLESILVNQMRKVLDDSEIYTVTLDGDKEKKSRKELIKLDVSKATL